MNSERELEKWQKVNSAETKEQLFEQIALGDLLPQLVASRLFADQNPQLDLLDF